jgi:hypothetical protein
VAEIVSFGQLVKKATAEKDMGPSTSGRDAGTKERQMDGEHAILPNLGPLEDPVLFPKVPDEGEQVPEGVNVPLGNFPEMAPAGDAILLRRSERSMRPTQ